MLFKNSVRTSKRTPHFTITKINWLTLFKEIIAVYSENNRKATKKSTELLIVKGVPLDFKGLKPKLISIIFKDPVRTSKRTPDFTITKTSCLTLFKEMLFTLTVRVI
jgi:hypothetical protein